MPSDGIAGPHLVRYGTAADQKFLVGPFADTYDQLVINANMVAHMPSALATLVTQRAKKPFFIDPQTHAFQHPAAHLTSPKTGELRKSIRKLVEAYGDPVSGPVVRGESVIPADFADPAAVEAFCASVLDFQELTLKSEVEDSEDAKYYAFLAEEGALTQPFNSIRPSLLIAPYFYLSARTVIEWLPVNIACAAQSITDGSARGLPVGVQVVLSQDVLRSSSIDTVIAAYRRVNPAYFLVWVDDLAEDDTSVEMLQAQVAFLRALGDVAPIVNLYGGYFSVALMHTKKLPRLVGVTHSLEYGESRAVVPVGGGVPVAKFYLPALHTRLVTRSAVRAIQTLDGFQSRDVYLECICTCAECMDVIRDNPEADFAAYGETTKKVVRGRGGTVTREYPTTETKEHCVRHYMWAKALEYDETANIATTCAALRDTATKLRRPLGDDVSHCVVWATVLES